MKDTLVIGDVHGHFDRLLALLVQEGIVDPATEERTNFDVEVVQLGDLGHFGKGGTPTGDRLCYEKADDWFDVVLWGNHDRAVIDRRHAFTGFESPPETTHYLMALLAKTGKLRFAHTAHGFLLTHAGLADYWTTPECSRTSRVVLGAVDGVVDKIERSAEENALSVNAVGRGRNGTAPVGGTLWRHHPDEKLANMRQVFGHTRGDKVRTFWNGAGKSYCIDIGSPHNGKLAGLWLPTEQVVAVQVG